MDSQPRNEAEAMPPTSESSATWDNEALYALSWVEIRRLKEKLRRNKAPGAPTLRRRAFCAADKKAVCEMHEANPDMSQLTIAKHFGIDRSMVSKVLSKKDQWLRSKHSDSDKFARKRFNRFDQLEVAMYPWVMNCRRDNVTLSDKSIREEAFRVAERLGMRGGGNEYQFYGGSKWLKTFKARFGIVNGVATRLGYSDGDLAREKAYGRYPLDEGFWNAMPDENGNFPDPWRISESKRKHMDYEIIDGVLQYIPREDASGEATVSSPEEAPVSSNSDGAPFEVADDPVPSLATPISVEVSAELFSSELGCLPLDPSITLPSPFLSSDSANASSTHPSGPTSFPTSTEEVTFLQHTIAPSFSPPYLPCDTLTASPFAAPGLPGRAVAQPTVLLSGTLPPSSHVSYSPSDTPSYSLPHLSSPDASTFPPLVFHSPHAPPSLSAELGAALDFPDVSSFPSSTFGSPSTSSVESSVTHSPPLLPPQYTLPNDAHSVDCWSGTTSGVVSQITVGHLPTHTLGPASYSPFDHFPDTENPDVLQCQWMAGQPTYTAGWMAADAMPCITASTRKP